MNLSSIQGKVFFTSDMPDVSIPANDATQVSVEADGDTLIDELMYPIGGFIILTSLGELLEPYARKRLSCSVTIAAGNSSATCTVLFAMADVGMEASDFYGSHFLTILQGEKVTAMGRREQLWYYGNESAYVTAEYDDGTEETFNAVIGTSTSSYTCIMASPDYYTASGKTLVAYTVSAGYRSQRFVVDLKQPDCAPILEFYNSFGVWEQIYCTGTHKVAPEYKRSTVRVNGLLTTYKVDETRKFEADTGILTVPMANWADELFRSDEVYVLNVINGTLQTGGKMVVITDSKSEVTNDDDNLPHFSFTYQYAQRIHNVLQAGRVGRIFDNTFDHTFN